MGPQYVANVWTTAVILVLFSLCGERVGLFGPKGALCEQQTGLQPQPLGGVSSEYESQEGVEYGEEKEEEEEGKEDFSDYAYDDYIGLGNNTYLNLQKLYCTLFARANPVVRGK